MKNNKKGFTIVELVIVIAVIGILAAVLIPTFGTVIANAERSGALQEAKVAMEMTSMVEDTKLAGYYYVICENYVFEYDASKTGIENTKPVNFKDMFGVEKSQEAVIEAITTKAAADADARIIKRSYANSEAALKALLGLAETADLPAGYSETDTTIDNVTTPATVKYNSDISSNVVVIGGFKTALTLDSTLFGS